MQNYKKGFDIVLIIKYSNDVYRTKWQLPNPDVCTATVLEIKRNDITYKSYLKKKYILDDIKENIYLLVLWKYNEAMNTELKGLEYFEDHNIEFDFYDDWKRSN